MDAGTGDFGTVTSQLATKARLLASDATVGPPELNAIGLAKELGILAQAALRLAVERAQNAGQTWEDIAKQLGISAQTAYQRFGRMPTAPDESKPPVIADAGDRAVTVLTDWFEERYENVAATFDETMAKTFPADGLAMARTQVLGTAGAYQRLGDRDPLVRQAGDYTVADVPLVFGSGLMKGRVSFDRSGQVAGLYVLPPGTP